MFVRYGAPKYVDGSIVFAVSKREGDVCSFRVSKARLEALGGKSLDTPVEVLEAFWRHRGRIRTLALQCYQAGARVELDRDEASA